MEIKVKNNNGETTIDVKEGDCDCGFMTSEEYDIDGKQLIKSSVIDATGFPNPSFVKKLIEKELSRKGFKIIND